MDIQDAYFSVTNKTVLCVLIFPTACPIRAAIDF